MTMNKNPNKIPASLAEAEEAHKKGMSDGTGEGMLVYLSALRDKEGFGNKRLRRLWDKVCEVCDLLTSGAILTPELARNLYDVVLVELCPYMYYPDRLFSPPDPPVTKADVNRSYKQGREAGRQFATLIFMSAIRKTDQFGGVRIWRLFSEATEMWDSIDKGYIKPEDLQQTLYDEAGIKVV